MSDADFLDRVADRLVHVYGESEHVDFVLKLRRMAESLRTPAQDPMTLSVLVGPWDPGDLR